MIIKPMDTQLKYLQLGIVPDGWVSVFKNNPTKSGFYKTIISAGSISPKCLESVTMFTSRHGVNRWHESDWKKVLAWKPQTIGDNK